MDDDRKDEQLEDILQIEASTMRNVWREYPHYFITEASRKSGNLKGARFSKDDVLSYLKRNSEKDNGSTKIAASERNSLSSVFQAEGRAIQQDLLYNERGKRVGNNHKNRSEAAMQSRSKYDVSPR